MDYINHYNTVSKQYSVLRPPIGEEVISALIKNIIPKETQNIKVLDAGCGAGLFTKYLIGDGFRHVTLLDASEGMLSMAKTNLVDEIEKGYIDDIVNSTLPAMPFSDQTFDVVIFSLVLDFVEKNPNGSDYPGIIAAMTEARRVLSPEGMVSIVTSSPRAFVESVWFTQMIPETAMRRYIKKYPTMSQWEDICHNSGFRIANKIGLLGPEVIGPWYNDHNGPIKKEWRNTVTIWKMLTEEELEIVERRIEEITRNSSLAQYKIEHDKTNEIADMNALICIPK